MMLIGNSLARPEILGIFAGVIGCFVLFTYLSIATYLAQRRKERETYYRFELRRKALEQGAPAEVLLEMQRQEESLRQKRRRESLRLGGLITAGTGLGFLGIPLAQKDPEGLGVALLPFFIGAAIYIYAQWMAPRGTDESKGGPGGTGAAGGTGGPPR